LTGGEAASLVGDIPLGFISEVNVEKSYTKPTFRVALDHRFSDALMGYVSYNRGFKSGGFTPSDLTGLGFNPETLDAYETGLKSDLLDRRLRLNAAFFYYNYKDIQVTRLVAAGIGVVNGAGARIYGSDFDADMRITEAFTLTARAELLHSRFTSFDNAPTGTPEGGVPVVAASATGNRVPLSPTATLSLIGNYAIPLPKGVLDLNARYYRSTGWFAEADNIIHQPKFDTVGASIQWTSPGNTFNVRAWGENLGNTVYQRFAVTLQPGTQVEGYAPPRTYGVSVGFKF
jgi:iron complex outermembrane receptor protein